MDESKLVHYLDLKFVFREVAAVINAICDVVHIWKFPWTLENGDYFTQKNPTSGIFFVKKLNVIPLIVVNLIEKFEYRGNLVSSRWLSPLPSIRSKRQNVRLVKVFFLAVKLSFENFMEKAEPSW